MGVRVDETDQLDQVTENDVYFVPQLDKKTQNYLNSVKPVMLQYDLPAPEEETSLVESTYNRVKTFFTSNEVEDFKNKYR